MKNGKTGALTTPKHYKCGERASEVYTRALWIESAEGRSNTSITCIAFTQKIPRASSYLCDRENNTERSILNFPSSFSWTLTLKFAVQARGLSGTATAAV